MATKALVKLAVNTENNLIDSAGNKWQNHDCNFIMGRFTTTKAINLNANKYLVSNTTFTLKQNEMWYISFWSYKTIISDTDVILGGDSSKLYSIQNSDRDSNNGYGTIGLKINQSEYSIQDTTLQPLSQWTHIYITCDGNNNIYLFINGEYKSSQIMNTNLIFNPLILGGYDGSNTEGNAGYIDDLIIVEGQQLYTTDFTPPTKSLVFNTGTYSRLISISLPPDDIIDSYIANNRITYFYRVTFKKVNDLKAKYTLEYSANSTSYEILYSDKEYDFTEENFSNSKSTLINLANMEIEYLKKFVDTLIGNVNIPGNITKIYKAKNGITYYTKISFEPISSLTTQYVMAIKMEWGTKTNTYNNTYKIQNYVITSDNYKSYISDISHLSDTLSEECEEYLDTLVGTIYLPGTIYREITSSNRYRYYFRTHFSIQEQSDNKVVIAYTTMWDKNISYFNTWNTKTYTVTANNYSTHTEDVEDLAKQELNKCIQSFDVISSDKFYIRLNSKSKDIVLYKTEPSVNHISLAKKNGENLYMKSSNIKKNISGLNIRKDNTIYNIGNDFETESN